MNSSCHSVGILFQIVPRANKNGVEDSDGGKAAFEKVSVYPRFILGLLQGHFAITIKPANKLDHKGGSP